MTKVFIALALILFFASCRTTKGITNVIAPKDTTAVVDRSKVDSIANVEKIMAAFNSNYIDFNTFSAKIKAEVVTSKEKLPDLTAVIRIQKDKAIWMSISATFLNIELYRVFITPDSIILLNKKDREVQYRSVDYLTEITQIPFDFKTMQNLLIGNPVFYNGEIQSFRQVDNLIVVSAQSTYFKHLMSFGDDNKLLILSKLDDVDVNRNRTALISYNNYENISGHPFSTDRHIVISEKNKIDMQLKFKQVEFNKELSMSFNVPKNYTIK